MNRKEWYHRYYRPLPANIHVVSFGDQRERDLGRVTDQVMDLHAFGQMLYHDVIARNTGEPFTGYPAWFAKAIAKGWVPKPNKPFPVGTVNQALLLFNLHTVARFEAWSDSTKVPTFGSYLGYLRRIKVRYSIPISLVPITDPFTRESMTRRRVN